MENVMMFIATTSDKLADIEVKVGQMIFCQDTRAIWLDGSAGRVSYQQIITLNTEADRSALAIPLRGFYFISDTSVLWNYDGEWHQISSVPDEQIVFASRDDFPAAGSTNIIYIDGTIMYRYIDGEYQSMSGSLNWGSFS